ncbi:MAG: hypothetical protein ACLU9S_07400 [Oscillospiraceae bacterium]
MRQNSFYQSGAMLLTALLFIASLVPTRFAAGSVGEVNLHMGQSADTVYLTYTSSSRTAAPVRVPAGSAAYLAQSSWSDSAGKYIHKAELTGLTSGTGAMYVGGRRRLQQRFYHCRRGRGVHVRVSHRYTGRL